MIILLFNLLHLSTSQPNVLIINIQQIGWGDVDVYTPWRSDTPGIDRIARQGIVLDQVYCETAPAASQAGLLSGKLPASWGFYSSNNAETSTVHEDSLFALPTGMKYLPQELKHHSSMFIGRWLLGQSEAASPLNYGFNMFYGVVSDRDGKYTSLPNPGLYRDSNILGRLFESPGLELDHGLSNLTQQYQAEAVSFIKERTQPFYLHMSLDALVHSPYRSGAWINSSTSSRHTHFTEALREIDDTVSVIYDTLLAEGIADNTVILIAGDSTALASRFTGGNNAPFSGQFQDTTEGGVRVPAVLYYPGARIGRSKQVMNMQDLHSTLLSLCGVNIEPCNEGCVARGIDMSNALQTGVTHDRVVPIYRGRTLMALRLGRYKAHRYAEQSFIPGQFLDELTQYKLADFTKAPLLYDVITDPTERFTIGGGFPIGSERYTSVISDILQWANTILDEVVEDGGLLNECDVSAREWSPEGCAALGVCHTQLIQSKLALCSLPFD